MSKDEKTKATAACREGHTWPCEWWVETKELRGGVVQASRIVRPLQCPKCRKAWISVK